MIKLQAEKAKLTLLEPPELLTTGMQRVVMCELIFGPVWDGLHKTAVFRAGDMVRDVPEESWEEGACPIPPEVLRKAGLTVLIGVYGTDGERVVLPTVWCSLGAVQAGADPSGDPSADESLPVWEGLRQELLLEVDKAKKELLASPGMYQDVTQEYLEALKADRNLTGQDFLQAFPDGNYCILRPNEHYFARNVTSDAVPYSEITFYEDDGYVYHWLYAYHKMQEEWESLCNGEMRFLHTHKLAEIEEQFPTLQKKAAQSALYTELSRKRDYPADAVNYSAQTVSVMAEPVESAEPAPVAAASTDTPIGDGYQLVTDISQLQDGDTVVIASASADVAIGYGATSYGNNSRYAKPAKGIIKHSNGQILRFSSNVDVFTLVESDSPGQFYFRHTGTGYDLGTITDSGKPRILHAYPSIGGSATLDVKWNIEVYADGTATMKNQSGAWLTCMMPDYNAFDVITSDASRTLALYRIPRPQGGRFVQVKTTADILDGDYLLMVKASGTYKGDATYHAMTRKMAADSCYAYSSASDNIMLPSPPPEIDVANAAEFNGMVWTLQKKDSRFALSDRFDNCYLPSTLSGSILSCRSGNPLFHWDVTYESKSGTFQIFADNRYLGVGDDDSKFPAYRQFTVSTKANSSSYQFYLYRAQSYPLNWFGDVCVVAQGHIINSGDNVPAGSFIRILPNKYPLKSVTCNGTPISVSDAVCGFYLTDATTLGITLDEPPTYPVTWSIDPLSTASGEISATVDGVAIANGEEVSEDKTVKFAWRFSNAVLSKLLINGVDCMTETTGAEKMGSISVPVGDGINAVATVDTWAAPNLLVVGCNGLEAGERYALHLYTVSRHSGRKYGKWRHPANYDAERPTYKIGYGVLASESSWEVPEWMPNGGFLQTEWPIDPETKEVIIDLRKWLLPMVKQNSSGMWNGLMGVAQLAIAPILLQFRIVRLSDGYVGECRQTLAVGKVPNNGFMASPAVGDVRVMYTSIR